MVIKRRVNHERLQKQTVARRPQRAAAAILTGLVTSVAVSPLLALLNVAVANSVYGNDNQEQEY
jgi:hypothetical protein